MNKPDAKRMTLLLYLAEQHHLVNWGLPLLTTKFTADKAIVSINGIKDLHRTREENRYLEDVKANLAQEYRQLRDMDKNLNNE